MEIAWACGIALSVALCADGLLGCLPVAPAAAPDARELLAGFRVDALGRLQALGRVLAEAGLPPERVRACIVEELRGLSVRGRQPFKDWEGGALLGSIAVASAACGVLFGVLAWSPLGAVLGLIAPAAGLWARASARARAAEAAVTEAMPEAFGSLAISLGSGLSLPQAMRYVGGHSEEPVKGHFLRASFSMSCGVSAAEALDDMVSSFDAPGLELVSLALKISQRTGAPLKDLLAEASQLTGERIELARRLDVKTAQARMSAQLVAAMPVAMVGLLSLLSSDFRSGLATQTGAAAVSVALVLNLVAWMIIRKIMKVEL